MDRTPVAAASPLVAIDGQGINIATIEDLIGKAIASLTGGRGFSLFTLNMDHLVKRRSDAAFRAAYERATFVSADGAPLVWMARRSGVTIERTTGADLLLPLCAEAGRRGIPVAFYGSDTASLQAAANSLRSLHPSLDIRHLEAPPRGFDPGSREAYAAAARIARSGARLCFVALGAPKQELFADRMLRLHPDIGFLGIGAALDFVAGTQRRAPAVVQKLGCEWLWRLGGDPRRMFVRYLRCAAMLAALAVVEPLQRRVSAAAPNANG